MEPYEALYERLCRSPICWTEVGKRSPTGSNLVRDTSEKVDLIRKRLLTTSSLYKSYANRRRRPLEFEVGDQFFLKVMPKRGVVKFVKRGKLAPRYIGPFERGWAQLHIGWRYHQVYQVSIRCSMSPCSISILQIQLM